MGVSGFTNNWDGSAVWSNPVLPSEQAPCEHDEPQQIRHPGSVPLQDLKDYTCEVLPRMTFSADNNENPVESDKSLT